MTAELESQNKVNSGAGTPEVAVATVREKPYVTKVVIEHVFDTCPNLDYLTDEDRYLGINKKTRAKYEAEDAKILAEYESGQRWTWIVQAKADYIIPKVLNGYDSEGKLRSSAIGGIDSQDQEEIKVYDNEELEDIKHQCIKFGIEFPANTPIEVKEVWEH